LSPYIVYQPSHRVIFATVPREDDVHPIVIYELIEQVIEFRRGLEALRGQTEIAAGSP
jgi:hypothetical protein